MGHQRQLRLEPAHTRKVPNATDEVVPHRASLAPTTMARLQRTIGNQAVQRLLDASTLQRAPNDEKADSTPSAVAVIDDIKGSSRIAGHEGKLEVLGVRFERDQTPAPNRREDRESPRKRDMTVILTRNMDAASPILSAAASSGQSVKSLKIDFIRRTSDGKFETVRTFEFSNGTFSGYAAGGSNDGIPTEQVQIVVPEPQT